MTPFRVLVVDDEPLAREVVVDLLRRDADVVGITETGDPHRVAAMLSSGRPDIMFLDIEMPGLSGVQIASSVDGDLPAIVFVTAFSQYAIDAFGVQAIDYLLKPFSDERFFQALDRAKRRVNERRTASAVLESSDQARKEFLKQLTIGHGAGASWIDVDDVVWIEAEDYYVLVHTRRDRHLLRASMSSLEDRLDPRMFVRAHRAAIVNVREVTRLDSDAAALVLSDGTQIAIIRSRRPRVEQLVRARLDRGT